MKCGTSSATKRHAGRLNVVANVRRAPLPLSYRLLQQTTDVLAIQYHFYSYAELYSFLLYRESYDELFFRKTFRNTSKPGNRAASGPLEASSHSSSTKTSDRSLPPHRSLLFPVSFRQFCDTRSCTFMFALCKDHILACWGSRILLHVPRYVPWRLHAYVTPWYEGAMGRFSMGVCGLSTGVYKGGD
jgi:hypothetical protein